MAYGGLCYIIFICHHIFLRTFTEYPYWKAAVLVFELPKAVF